MTIRDARGHLPVGEVSLMQDGSRSHNPEGEKMSCGSSYPGKITQKIVLFSTNKDKSKIPSPHRLQKSGQVRE